MDKTCVTVTMPIFEYEKLRDIEEEYISLISMLKRANREGNKAVLTDELRRFIEDIRYTH